MLDHQTDMILEKNKEVVYKSDLIIPSDQKCCRYSSFEFEVVIRRIYSFFDEYTSPWFANKLLGFHIANLKKNVSELVELVQSDCKLACEKLETQETVVTVFC